MQNYDHKVSEAKWQKIWLEQKIFNFDENSTKPKYYVLEMFPYPSGKIHMGHLRNYAIGDCLARFKSLQGFNVLHPMGFDAFGLPAENAALEHKIHPQDWTLSNIKIMRSELESIGLAIDWQRQVVTCLPEYYKHEQKMFLDFFKAGLAYQKESFVNWDPIDQTVLANEQVIDGRGWRSGALVEKKKLKQWFLKVSQFSEELLSELKNLPNWDERVLSMQEKWIGKSEGLLIDFEIVKDECIIHSDNSLKIYTTRPDTLFGASFVAISPNHPLAEELAKNNQQIKEFITQCNRSAVDEQTIEKQEKNGIATGLKVTHPLDENWKLDIYIANFVLMDYGTGAIFGCPAHDQRDFEFAQKYNLPIKIVVANLNEYLVETNIINFNSEEVQNLVKKIKSKVNSEDEVELVKAAYHLVRDEIDHAMDDKKYLNQKPNLKASEVVKNNNAFCFGKSVLLAAILRALNIPCGFSDQLLMFDEEISDRKIIHTINVVYLKSLKKWIRLDARGNKPQDVNAQFDLNVEVLAYEARPPFNEINDLGTYSNICAEAIKLHQFPTNAEVIDNLFVSSSFSLKEALSDSDISSVMINSNFLNGLTSKEAKEKVAEILSAKNIAQKRTNYRLRDWGVSRQRYWGCPIPILYLEDGTAVPVPENQLPVELPKDVTFDGLGNPLEKHPTWKYTTYTKPDGTTVKAIRETDTFDTFFESSWYFLRYISQPQDRAFNAEKINKFMPVDQYIGGIEHAVLHLLYARFFTKALRNCGYFNISEPFASLLTQGMVCHQTYKDNEGRWVHTNDTIKKDDGKYYHTKTNQELTVGRSEKMSKSKKNVVEPAGIIEKYGADTARLFMLSDTPPARDLDWSDSGIDGCYRYINRLWRLVEANCNNIGNYDSISSESHPIIRLTHKTIKEVQDEFEKMGFNRAIAKIREFSNAIEKLEVKSDEDKKIMRFALNNLLILIAPIMPHLAEELWQMLGNTSLISAQKFPKFNEALIADENVKIAVQVLGKLRAVIELSKDSIQEIVEQAAKNNENVSKFIEGKEVKRVIFIPNKLINFII